MQAVLRQSGLTKKLAYVYAVERRNLLGASAIHFTAAKERLNTRILRCNRRGVVVPNMVDLQEFAERPPRDVARHGLGLAPQAAIIAYLGRLHDRKGIDLLIQGFRMLADEDKDARLVIAGPDDGAEAKLRALVSALELQTQVLFMGYLDMRQKKDLLVASDITALVSHPGDNFGQSAAESLAMGTPVLLSENVCIAEDLAKDGAAVAVPTDGDAIGRTLIRLMLDKELLRRMGDQGAESVRRRYSPEVVTRQMLDVYRRVLTCGVAPHDSVPSRRI
jgi:glycosyltransferase involved in cell wall biosynthesis